mgnify:CR=1 FL=1
MAEPSAYQIFRKTDSLSKEKEVLKMTWIIIQAPTGGVGRKDINTAPLRGNVHEYPLKEFSKKIKKPLDKQKKRCYNNYVR